jgi:hypothetical protein
MKRDMDLVRAILERVQELPLEGGPVQGIERWTEDNIIHHLDVLQDGG